MKKKMGALIVVLLFVTMIYRLISLNSIEKIKVYDSYQYLAINKKEDLVIQLVIIDQYGIINENNEISIMLKGQDTLKIEEYDIYELEELDTKDCLVYQVNMKVSEKQLEEKSNKYTKLVLTDGKREYSTELGTILIEKVNFSEENEKINILATLFSLDGYSFNIVVQNETNSKICINDIYCNVIWNKSKYGILRNNVMEIKPHMANEQTYFLADELKEKYVVIRPIISYTYNNREYKSLSHESIYFNTRLSERDIKNKLGR